MIDEEEYELVSLAPDMREVWGRVMKVLRDTGEDMLYALCQSLDVMFDRETIIITIQDEGTHKLVSKHRKKLDEITGEGIIQINRTKAKKSENPVTKQLKELFGDKLVIIK